MNRIHIRLGRDEEKELNNMIEDIRRGLEMSGIRKKVSKNQAVKFLLFQKKRRGQFYSLLAAFVLVLLIGVVALLAGKYGEMFTDELTDQSEVGTVEHELMTETGTRLPNILQSIFLIIFFGVGVATLVSSFLVRNVPIMATFMVLVLIIMNVATPVLANMYEGIANTAENEGISDKMGAMKYVFDWFPRIMLALSIVAMILMFAKGGGDQ